MHAHQEVLAQFGLPALRVALSWSYDRPTQRPVREAIVRRETGLRGKRMEEAVVAADNAATRIRDLRKTRERRQRRQIIGSVPVETRLLDATRAVVVPAIHDSLRVEGAGEVTFDVRFTHLQPGASVETFKDFTDRYGGRRHYCKTASHVKVLVGRDYLRTVAGAGLAVVDGLPTMAAKLTPCDTPGVLLYQATWLEQGRGLSVRIVGGYIARRDGGSASYHADTEAATVRGLLRKGAAAAASDAMGVVAFAERWGGSRLTVTLADAKAVGACDPGIRSWCAMAGLSGALRAGRTTAGALARAYRKLPLPEVRRTILHAAKHVTA